MGRLDRWDRRNQDIIDWQGSEAWRAEARSRQRPRSPRKQAAAILLWLAFQAFAVTHLVSGTAKTFAFLALLLVALSPATSKGPPGGEFRHE